MASPRNAEQVAKDIARDQSDFVRRLYAVAVSIGLATALLDLPWMRGKDAPSDAAGWAPSLYLLIGIVAIVLSWDSYTSSTQFRHIRNRWLAVVRLFVDFLIISCYLTMLLKTNNFALFSTSVFLFFILYCVWDLITIAGARSTFYVGPTLTKSELRKFVGPYHVALAIIKGEPDPKLAQGDRRIHLGPKITLVWTLYMFVAWSVAIKIAIDSGDQNEKRILQRIMSGGEFSNGLDLKSFFISFCILYGIVIYRVDKRWGGTYLPGDDDIRIFGFTCATRTIFLVLGVALCWLTLCLSTSFGAP